MGKRGDWNVLRILFRVDLMAGGMMEFNTRIVIVACWENPACSVGGIRSL